jgi:hypothetical protein
MMKKKLRPGEFAVGIFITVEGINDLRVIAKDKDGMNKAKRVLKVLSPSLKKLDVLSAPANILQNLEHTNYITSPLDILGESI